MDQRIREFEKQSGLEIYGLGTDRDKWEHAISEFAELITFECVKLAVFKGDADTGRAIKEHFGVE